jgi:hypothetical protein
MRWAIGLVAVLVAAAAALVLSTRQTTRDVDAARRSIPSLHEDVPARSFDGEAAKHLVARLTDLLGTDTLPEDELHEATTTAAGWAAGATPGSPSYHAAVSLRAAADELLASRSPGDPHRARARQLLDEAAQALTGTVGMPGGPAGGIRDQLRNLEYSQQEKLREIEKQAP